MVVVKQEKIYNTGDPIRKETKVEIMTVGAVIVTYNPSISDLKSLVDSIEESVKVVVIVDNGSNNFSEIKLLEQQYSLVETLPLNENKGIGCAQNRGMEFLFKDPAIDAVVLFDHDSHPSHDMINVLISDYQNLVLKGCKVAAVGPVFMDPRTNNLYPIPVFSGFRLKKVYAAKGDVNPVVTSFLIASGSLIPKKIIEEVGMMNEGFFIDYIDIEWSFRVNDKGYALYTCPAAKMNHQIGDQRMKILGREISVHSPIRRYYLARNSVLMIKLKHVNWRYKVREFFYSVTRVVVFITSVDKKSAYLKYILKGWYDGINGKMGRL